MSCPDCKIGRYDGDVSSTSSLCSRPYYNCNSDRPHFSEGVNQACCCLCLKRTCYVPRVCDPCKCRETKAKAEEAKATDEARARQAKADEERQQASAAWARQAVDRRTEALLSAESARRLEAEARQAELQRRAEAAEQANQRGQALLAAESARRLEAEARQAELQRRVEAAEEADRRRDAAALLAAESARRLEAEARQAELQGRLEAAEEADRRRDAAANAAGSAAAGGGALAREENARGGGARGGGARGGGARGGGGRGLREDRGAGGRSEEVQAGGGGLRRAGGAGEEVLELGAGEEAISTASHAELAAATYGFADAQILGRGGFGAVYKGEWRGRAVAVKRLDADSTQGMREASREIGLLGRYRHEHLVPLWGFSLALQGGRPVACLVYPLMPGGDLQRALAAAAGQPLSAAARLRIAADAAAGLAYLHAPGGGLPPVLHRDVKSSNVLLDNELRARIGDVGVARQQRGTTMTGGVGTFGYIDPEYVETGEYTAGSDAFSLGVVLLELLTSGTAVDPTQRPPNLYARLRPRLPFDAPDLAEPAAGFNVATARGLATVAAGCIRSSSFDRPRLAAVLRQLEALCSLPSAAGDGGWGPVVRECVVCMDAPRQTRLRPCCHVLLCSACATDLLRQRRPCPHCRAAVDRCEEGVFDATYAP